MTTTDSASRLKDQRDRFIAFAFAGAEVLIELNGDGVITYCAGTTEQMLGTSAKALTGQGMDRIVSIDDQGVLDELRRRILTAGRVDHASIMLQRADGFVFRGVLSGITFPDRPGLAYVTLSRATASVSRSDEPHVPVRGEEDFTRLAERRFEEAGRFGEDYRMTLIDLAGSDLAERMDEASVRGFARNVESYLMAWSVGGNSVGVLDDNKYGIIHDPSFKPEQVGKRLSDMAAVFDPSGEGLPVKASTIGLGEAALTKEDLSKALVYTINSFVVDGTDALPMASLSEQYEHVLDETLGKVNAFRQTIASDGFVLVYQPIVCLRTWQVHHYEALSRMTQGERLFLPARFIAFAEEFGVVNEFDLTVLRKALTALEKNTHLRTKAEIAVNLSGRSLSSEGFVQQLLLMLLENRRHLPRLMFEVTESAELKDLEAANRILQKLRGLGCKVSIDDFGAGAAAFQYLKALEVDYVKIDGAYILDAFRSRHGKPFLKAISQLCQDLGIQTIGEMVEDARTMWLLRDLGIDYGQGFFFGRPQVDVSDFMLPAQPQATPAPL
jgi:EAL domain-containing protein (putative c-di-GMP-specific phosphodiesterase class I)/PAS domain-containing protein